MLTGRHGLGKIFQEAVRIMKTISFKRGTVLVYNGHQGEFFLTWQYFMANMDASPETKFSRFLCHS